MLPLMIGSLGLTVSTLTRWPSLARSHGQVLMVAYQPNINDDVSEEQLLKMMEELRKQNDVLLRRLDELDQAMTAVPGAEAASAVAPAATDEEAAKRAWLSRLDAPAWGKVAQVMEEVATEAAHVAALSDACDDGDESACDTLSSEDEAKSAWLAKLDAPAWGGVAAAVASVSGAPPSSLSEDGAKAAWLSKLDAPAWGKAALAITEVATEAVHAAALSDACDDGDESACDTLSSEDEAKSAWLAKLDAPAWGGAAAAVSAVASAVIPPSADAAKSAWLSKLDVPAWGGKADTAAATPAPPAPAPAAVPANPNTDSAKAAWLSKLDRPAWGGKAGAAAAPAPAATPASANAVPAPAPIPAAVHTNSAKAAWLSKLDRPAWGGSTGSDTVPSTLACCAAARLMHARPYRFDALHARVYSHLQARRPHPVPK